MKTAILNIERTAYDTDGARALSVVEPTGAVSRKLRMGAYARVSSDSEDQIHSYISQVRHYAAVIGENPDWEFVDVYADEGLTGLDADKRPEFQRMISDCRKEKLDRILVKSVSRFARNFTDCIETIHELKQCGVSVLFEKENIDTAKINSEMFLAMHAGKAQRESMSISGNLRRGVRMKMKTGDFFAPAAPFGYRLNSEARTLEVVPEQAEIVKRIFASYLSGQGKKNIADMLNNESVEKGGREKGQSHLSTRWCTSTIYYILTNTSYTGDMIWQKYYATDTIPIKMVQNKGEMLRYYVQNSHQPIISHEDFENVQRLMSKKREQYYKGTPAADTPLANLVYCECGAMCRRKVNGGTAYRVCRTHDIKGKRFCPVRQVPETEIYAAFSRMWHKLCRNQAAILNPLLEHLKLVMERKHRCDETLTELNKELVSLSEQVHVLERLNGKEYLEPALYISEKTALNTKITALRKTKDRLLEDDNVGCVQPVEDLIAALNTGEPDGESFREIVEKATVMAENKIRFCLRCGLELTESIERSVR